MGNWFGYPEYTYSTTTVVEAGQERQVSYETYETYAPFNYNSGIERHAISGAGEVGPNFAYRPHLPNRSCWRGQQASALWDFRL